MSVSFEYTIFQMGDGPSVESLSDLVVRLCMEEESRHEDVIGHLVEALHGMRTIEAEQTVEDDEDDTVPVVEDVEKEFRDAYRKICKEEGVFCDDESGCWSDNDWPIDAQWHQDEVRRLARLMVGHDAAFREQCRKMMGSRSNT